MTSAVPHADGGKTEAQTGGASRAAAAAKPERDLVARLTGAGEEAMQRLGDLPGGKTLLDTAQTFREGLDDLAARMRSIDPLEKRVTAIEQRLAALEKKPASRKPAPRKPAAKKASPAKKG